MVGSIGSIGDNILPGLPLGIGGTLTPTLTLSGPLAFTAGAAAGTLVANIGNVPSGVTPTITPGDGRLVVAGSTGAWTVVVGMSASTAGTISLAVAATGATGASASVTVAAAATLPKIAAGISRVQSGGARSVVAVVADSTGAGWGGLVAQGTAAGASPGASASKPNSWPHQLSALLNTASILTRADAFFPGAVTGEAILDIASANPNMTFGTGWSITNIATLGGYFLTFTGATQGNLTFTPEVAANRFDFLVTSASGLGALTISDASGQLAIIDETNTGSTATFRLVTVQRAVASTSPITIVSTASKQTYICAIIPYDTTSPRLELLNMGFPGSKTSDWANTATNTPWDPYNALSLMSGYIDGSFLELGANDANAGVSASTYQANLQTIANRLAGYGDVQLVKVHKATSGGYVVPASYLTAIDAVAGSVSSAPAIDFNTPALVTADYYDNIHLSQQGYGKEAQIALTAFRAATKK